MPRFFDALYGSIEIPDWISPFLIIPEFIRLRDVRLSNVDSIDYKDFGSANRWSHAIGVAYLSTICATERELDTKDRIILTLAGLLHDVATPPFAHTAEYVLTGFSHEIETSKILSQFTSEITNPNIPIFGSALPAFNAECRKLSSRIGVKISPEEISECILGAGPLGFLISGTIDLDNADNVVRGSYFMGINVSRSLPVEIAKWLARQSSAPLCLNSIDVDIIKDWRSTREQYYSNFFSSSDQELGRQALLQHLMRRAISSGMSQSTLVWNTDSGFLYAAESIEDSDRSTYPLKDLVASYKLMDPIQKVVELDISSIEQLRSINSPAAIAWMENEICNKSSNMFLMITSNRSSSSNSQSIIAPPNGKLYIFKLGTPANRNHLPDWLQREININYSNGKKFVRALSEIIAKKVDIWTADAPWLASKPEQISSTISTLNSFSDWSFKHSKNRALHAYPGTFVHALPATIISALGLQGRLILDPFGGTGQTATEAIKLGCKAISADSNSVATLITRAKFTYLCPKSFDFLLNITKDTLQDIVPLPLPVFENREKWHHNSTAEQLSKIHAFIESLHGAKHYHFLKMCFSAILTSTTGRRGKEHGFFADNTPLERSLATPPFQDAFELFTGKIKNNINIIRQLYSQIERKGGSVEQELARVQTFQANIRTATHLDYGVSLNSVDGIITSPPYLCMADYSLGNRLTYNWLFPERLNEEYSAEIGSRRGRFSAKRAEEEYFQSLNKFGLMCSQLLRPSGFLAIVLGEPQASAFRTSNVMERMDEILYSNGLHLTWDKWRSIHWHRNQGYQRLRQERISIYQYTP